MLKARVLTAIGLLLVLLPALFRAPQSLWIILASIIVGVAAWEWGGLLRADETRRRLFALGTIMLCAVVAWLEPGSVGLLVGRDNPYGALHGGSLNLPLYVLAAVFWCVCVPFWLHFKWSLQANSVGWLVGLIVLVPSWLALVHLRSVDVPLLLAVLSIAWVADVAAYFAGRKFGRHKLAPSISPGKTWEGAAGALLGILAFGGLLTTTLVYAVSLVQVFLALCLITAISIIGDLFESLLKRQAGIKDSSNILPGHGGVLDRIDSLTSTLPLSALLLFWFFP